MPRQKKRSVHHCKTHPSVPAAGRCSVCKAWICRQCSAKRDHQIFCTDCGKKKESLQQQPAAAGAPKPSAQPALYSLIVPASITLAFCGIVFGLWLLRINHDLSDANRTLREKRVELLNQIRERNREIAVLKGSLEAQHSGPDSASVKGKRASAVRPFPDQEWPVAGLPFSFDNGTTQKKLVAITFDGSDHANAATDILDTLASRNVRSTMFLSGQFLRKHPDVVRRILSEGHEVGNHTFSHPHLTSYAQDHTQTTLPSVSETLLGRELAKTDSLFFALTQARLSPLWRAPYGEYNRTICIWGQRAGYLHIGWRHGRSWRQSLDSNDWIPDEEAPGYHTPQEVFDKIVSMANDPENNLSGGIVLMHLGTVRTSRDRQVHLILGKLIDTLQRLDYQFVTVSTLLDDARVDRGLLAGSKASVSRP
jgi:peptidoglycan/xylan/chitin deacetylase (PgdA/CDA1 family)